MRETWREMLEQFTFYAKVRDGRHSPRRVSFFLSFSSEIADVARQMLNGMKIYWQYRDTVRPAVALL